MADLFDPLERVRLWRDGKEWAVAFHLRETDPYREQELWYRFLQRLRNYANATVEEARDKEGWLWLCPWAVSDVFLTRHGAAFDAWLVLLYAASPEDIHPFHGYTNDIWDKRVNTLGKVVLESDQPPWITHTPD